jgi:site-specific recombinase XerD
MPIETVSKMLGNRSLKTTLIYSKVVDTKISKDMGQLELSWKWYFNPILIN